MSNLQDKLPNANGLDSEPCQRLASFKAPRDLSLGGVKPNKKVFTPNLNVTRNKNKGPSLANTRSHKKDDKNRKDRKNDRNKSMNHGPNVIKSGGVFSEGVGNAERHASRVSHGSVVESQAVTLQKPTIRVKDVVKIDKELEEQKVKLAMGNNKLPEDELCEDFMKTLDAEAPIKLPMGDRRFLKIQSKPASTVKQEVVVKKEPQEDECMRYTEFKPMPDVKKEVLENTDVVDLLMNDQPTMILLQFPDSLPGRGGSIDDDTPRRKANAEPSTSSQESHEETVQQKCYLSNLEEGRVGKIQIHRSGRVTLVLGTTALEVCSGTKSAFHQELMSMAVSDASRSANLVSLGPLRHKLCVVPDWETMFSDMPL